MCNGMSTSSNRENRGLAKKLSHAVLLPTVFGCCAILILYVISVLEDVPGWGAESKDVMIALEAVNIDRLALTKAEHTGEIFARVKENLLQLQAFGEQILMMEPETVVVNEYVESFPSLQHSTDTWNHSSWYITGFTSETSVPATGSSLDGLLNRTALMDVPFRGMQRQEALMYLTGLDDSSLPDDPDTSVALQAYPAFNIGDATTTQECDDRFDTGDSDFTPTTFDPRCRLWFQDARASNESIFTDPYRDWDTGLLTVTPAAPVYAADGTTLLGVVGIDMDFSVIEESILSLRVLDEEGYAYLLAPTGGAVAVHPELDPADTQNIVDLEVGVDEGEFGEVVARMTEQCKGSTAYEKNGGTWLVSWEHEKISGSGAGDVVSDDDGGVASVCSTGGFIVVVTISEAALLRVFSETESGIRVMVIQASVIMALVMVAVVCVTVAFARFLSRGLTEPVIQLVDIVRSLNNMDFSRQDPGLWMLNEVSCPEVEKLMDTFNSMTTVVKFANVSLESGNVEAAQQSYVDALVLFKKLQNSRGVAIVYNNLGNVYTLQARALSEEADRAQRKNLRAQVSDDLMHKANSKYESAVSNYRLAIEDAEMLISWTHQQDPGLGLPPQRSALPSTTAVGVATTEDDEKEEQKMEKDHSHAVADGEAPPADSLDIVEAQRAPADTINNNNDDGDDTMDAESLTALKLQLANRKFNLALCLAAKAAGCGDGLCVEEQERAAGEREEARRLIHECEALAAERNDALGNERRVEYLLALAKLEGAQPQASRALERAERVLAATPTTVTVPSSILRQRLLASRGDERLAAGDTEAAVGCWTEAVVGCDMMDPGAVLSSLVGLQEQVGGLDDSQGKNPFSEALVRGLGLPKGGGEASAADGERVAVSNAELTRSIKAEVTKIRKSMSVNSGTSPVRVDLCFVMDCTGSMGGWISQAKKKLFDIIEQTKEDIENLELRVAYIGYRDYGGCGQVKSNQYEGPYDFHSEEELPELEAKLKKITAGGGSGYVADVAGGLKRATEMSWSSPVRLCILFADAPCHGKQYHNVPDAYPKGCPLGVEPTEMIYKLQYELAVDFYFIRIAKVTDKMVEKFQSTVLEMAKSENKQGSSSGSSGDGSSRGGCRPADSPKFVVHNLGSNDNTFVDTVVESVKGSASGLNLRMEQYS